MNKNVHESYCFFAVVFYRRRVVVSPNVKGRTSSADEEDAGRPLYSSDNNNDNDNNVNDVMMSGGNDNNMSLPPRLWATTRGRDAGFVTLAKGITALGVVVMFCVIAWALSSSTAAGSNTAQVQWLINNPWGIVSLVDLYTGFTVFSLWICFREANRVLAAAWVIVMMTTGWLGGSLYVLNCLRLFKGDWQWFFMGHRSRQV